MEIYGVDFAIKKIKVLKFTLHFRMRMHVKSLPT